MRFKTRLKPSLSLIDLTPLVDVIFLMLIFFIVTSDILPLKSLQIENPELSQDAEALTTQLLVVMDAQNVIYVGSKKIIVDLNTLPETLNHELEQVHIQHQGAQPTLVVSVDRRVDYGTFLRLFAIVQETGQRIRLVYKPEDDSYTEYL